MKARHVTTILTSAYVLILLASSVATIGTSVAQSAPNVIPSKPLPKTVPMMNEKLMERLIKYIRKEPNIGSVGARICKVFDLCDGTKDMPLKLGRSDATDGIHYFGLPLEEDSKDILIMVKHATSIIDAYLTDKTGTLRAAAVLENGGATADLIANEKVAEKFKTELTLFAKEAAGLPATGTAVEGDKK